MARRLRRCPRLALLSLWAASLVPLARGKGQVRILVNSTRAAELALCAVDATQSALSLGQVGTAIRGAAFECGSEDGEAKFCFSTVASVISSISDVASFIASAASDCAPGVNLPEYCAADVSGLVGATTSLAAAATDLSETCRARNAEAPADEGAAADPAESEEALEALADRRLSGEEARGRAAPGPPSLETLVSGWQNVSDLRQRVSLRQTEIADCYFDVNSATTFLTRAGLAIETAVLTDCKPDGSGDNAWREACAVDFFGMIGSLADAASFISFAISNCPVMENVDALCAGDISTVLSGLAGIVSSATSFRLTCGGAGTGLPALVIPQRRLSAAAAGAAPAAPRGRGSNATSPAALRGAPSAAEMAGGSNRTLVI